MGVADRLAGLPGARSIANQLIALSTGNEVVPEVAPREPPYLGAQLAAD